MEILKLTKKTCMIVSPERIQSIVSGVAYAAVTKHGKALEWRKK